MDPPEPCAVYLSGLRLRHFRNLGIQDLSLPPEGVAVVGGNAQGKSNLLEAIYYLETFRSFRGGRDEQLVAFGEGLFRIEGRLVGGEGGVEVAAAFRLRGRRKKVTVDGWEAPRLSEALGRLAAVLFSPEDVTLVRGGPAGRRRFLDVVLSLNVPGYLETLQEYRRVLGQRNAALREGGGGELARAWEPRLVSAGARIMEMRRGWIARWAERFTTYYARISGGREGRMSYRPSVSLGSAEGEDALGEAFAEALEGVRDREVRLGSTVVGPHRDELVIRVEGEGEGGELELREYGSGGQLRTAALALRLVEADAIRESRGQEPIVLLDDVFAELDPERSERILELLETEERGQVILTAPKESDVRVRRNALARWRIRDGVVEG